MGVAARSYQHDGNSLHSSVAGFGRLKYGKAHGERHRKPQTVVPERGLAVYMRLWAGCVSAMSCSRHRNTCLQGGDLKPLGRFIDFLKISWETVRGVVRPCEAPVRLGCSIPLLNAFMGRRRGSHRLPVALYGTSTMSFFIGPSTPRSSFFSLAGTLNVSNALTRSSTRALKAAVVTFMPACAVFMSFPSYLQGPPLAWQTWSTSCFFRCGRSALEKYPLMRVSW